MNKEIGKSDKTITDMSQASSQPEPDVPLDWSKICKIIFISIGVLILVVAIVLGIRFIQSGFPEDYLTNYDEESVPKKKASKDNAKKEENENNKKETETEKESENENDEAEKMQNEENKKKSSVQTTKPDVDIPVVVTIPSTDEEKEEDQDNKHKARKLNNGSSSLEMTEDGQKQYNLNSISSASMKSNPQADLLKSRKILVDAPVYYLPKQNDGNNVFKRQIQSQ